MNLFVDAIKAFGSLDMLFYVPRGVDTDSESVFKLEKIFIDYWKADIRLFLCQRFDYPKNSSPWRRYAIPAFSFFKQTRYVRTSMPDQLKVFEKCLKNKPGAIFVHRLDSMCPLFLTNKKLPPVFFDVDDIEHVALFRNIKQPPRWFLKDLLYLQIPALRWGEHRAIRLARRTFVCSDLDKNYLTHLWNIKNITTIPNSVSIPDPQNITDAPNLLFIGSYSYEPNKNAVEFLLDKIWPLIHKEAPKARLIIAGDYPERIRHFDSCPSGVKFTGFVENITALYLDTRIILCPILSGGGTRIKIAEAASFGKPIVTTSIGIEGIDMKDEKEVLIRDTPESFAKACISLLKDKSQCIRLGSSARNYAIDNLSKGYALDKIQQQIRADLN